MKLSMIVAMANNIIIGLNNKMPWHLPADLLWFKKNAENKVVIMGRKTFESIGHHLPNRTNIVITKKHINPLNKPNDTTFFVNSIYASILLAEALNFNEAFIIGGSTIYQQTLPLISTLYLTHINADIKGDSMFPIIDMNKWNLVFKEYHKADEKNCFDYTFEILKSKGIK